VEEIESGKVIGLREQPQNETAMSKRSASIASIASISFTSPRKQAPPIGKSLNNVLS
jgi:hypothetical protein